MAPGLAADTRRSLGPGDKRQDDWNCVCGRQNSNDALRDARLLVIESHESHVLGIAAKGLCRWTSKEVTGQLALN